MFEDNATFGHSAGECFRLRVDVVQCNSQVVDNIDIKTLLDWYAMLSSIATDSVLVRRIVKFIQAIRKSDLNLLKKNY